jgi:hypothetical protein
MPALSTRRPSSPSLFTSSSADLFFPPFAQRRDHPQRPRPEPRSHPSSWYERLRHCRSGRTAEQLEQRQGRRSRCWCVPLFSFLCCPSDLTLFSFVSHRLLWRMCRVCSCQHRVPPPGQAERVSGSSGRDCRLRLGRWPYPLFVHLSFSYSFRVDTDLHTLH